MCVLRKPPTWTSPWTGCAATPPETTEIHEDSRHCLRLVLWHANFDFTLILLPGLDKVNPWHQGVSFSPLFTASRKNCWGQCFREGWQRGHASLRANVSRKTEMKIKNGSFSTNISGVPKVCVQCLCICLRCFFWGVFLPFSNQRHWTKCFMETGLMNELH